MAVDSTGGLREAVNNALADGDIAAVRRLLQDLWAAAPTNDTAAFVLATGAKLPAPPLSCRVTVLRSFTVEPLLPLAQAGALVAGIAARLTAGGFNTWAQELLAPDSALYREALDGVILAVEARDLCPPLVGQAADLSDAQIDHEVARATDLLQQVVSAFRERSSAWLLLHNFALPADPPMGLADVQSGRWADAFGRLNGAVRHLAQQHPGVYALDYDALVARFGRWRWVDEARYHTVRLPIAAEALPLLAGEWVRYLHPLCGKLAKVLVCDLDQTLWQGIVGEDGFDGIRVTPAHQRLQRAILDCARRGILLAVCSKNNPADAEQVLSEHPDLLLRPEHFAARRINWQDKATNLVELAEELQVGVDSLAFLDDSAVEREQVRIALPEVTVVPLPEQPDGYAAALRACPVFERLRLSMEDADRGAMMAAQRERDELRQATGSIESFLRSLELRLTISPLKPATVARAAQLTQRTNQFNMTTKRYGEAEIAALAQDTGWLVRQVHAVDRFGDNGIVGLLMVQVADAATWQVDTFLLSCRVIGRTIETAMLAWLVQAARTAGVGRLAGWFRPTAKNAPSADVYPEHGFAAVAQDGEATRWSLDLSSATVAVPPWIRLTVSEEAPSDGR